MQNKGFRFPINKNHQTEEKPPKNKDLRFPQNSKLLNPYFLVNNYSVSFLVL